MTIDVKPILRVSTLAQSASLAGNSMKLVKKKKKKVKDFLKVGATTIVGSALIKEQSDFIEGM